MLKNLSERIDDQVPRAVNNPILESHAYYYWSREAEGFTDEPDFELVRNEYDVATVSFSYEELQSLSVEEFLLLQKQLYCTVNSSFVGRGEGLSEEEVTFLIPDDSRNVLIHEKQHIDALPEEVRIEARVDVVIQIKPSGEVTIDGISVYNMERLDDMRRALVFSAPLSLSQTDIDFARFYARNLKDPAFAELVEERIKERNQH